MSASVRFSPPPGFWDVTYSGSETGTYRPVMERNRPGTFVPMPVQLSPAQPLQLEFPMDTAERKKHVIRVTYDTYNALGELCHSIELYHVERPILKSVTVSALQGRLVFSVSNAADVTAANYNSDTSPWSVYVLPICILDSVHIEGSSRFPHGFFNIQVSTREPFSWNPSTTNHTPVLCTTETTQEGGVKCTFKPLLLTHQPGLQLEWWYGMNTHGRVARVISADFEQVDFEGREEHVNLYAITNGLASLPVTVTGLQGKMILQVSTQRRVTVANWAQHPCTTFVVPFRIAQQRQVDQ